MTVNTTTILGLGKPVYNTEKDAWGDELNTNADLIDAAIDGIKLASGVVSSLGDLDLALSSAYTEYQLILSNVTTGSATQLFVRVTVGSVLTSYYDYFRQDISSSVTSAGGTLQGAVFLSPSLNAQSTDSDACGRFTIDINNRANATTSRINMDWRGNARSAGTGLTASVGGGCVTAQTARATAIKIGGYTAAGSSYTAGIRCSYLLIGKPSLA